MDYFRKILIPVDLTVNTEVAVKKALELAGPETMIHLLHVQNVNGSGFAYKYFVPESVYYEREDIEQKLNQWKKSIQETAGIKVCVWIAMDHPVQDVIAEKAVQLESDLIIIGKSSHHSWLPFLNTVVPSKLAQTTALPVLTVKPGSMHTKIKSVIVPVSSGKPEPKMEVISAICNKFCIKIYLVSFMNDNVPTDFHSSALLMMHQRIRAFSKCPVEYRVLHGENKAKLMLEFAREVDADMLLVHPDIETKIGWPSKHISDVLPAQSKMHVLAV